jgi:hypothetical protein
LFDILFLAMTVAVILGPLPKAEAGADFGKT